MYEVKEKPCKICSTKFRQYSTTQDTCCPECEAEKKRRKAEKKALLNEQGRIIAEMAHSKFSKKVVDNRKKITVRKVSEETKLAVFERDIGMCVIGRMSEEERLQCNELERTPHHVFYGGSEFDPSENRNNEEALVTICRCHHGRIHGGTSGKSQVYRQFAKDYLYGLYGEKLSNATELEDTDDTDFTSHTDNDEN